MVGGVESGGVEIESGGMIIWMVSVGWMVDSVMG